MGILAVHTQLAKEFTKPITPIAILCILVDTILRVIPTLQGPNEKAKQAINPRITNEY